METVGPTSKASIHPRPEPSELLRRWSRRTVTISVYAVALAVLALLLPFLLPAAMLIDLTTRRRFATTHLLVFLTFFFAMEMAGVFAAFFLWCSHRIVPMLDRPAFLQWNFRLQCWWGSTLLQVGRRIFGLQLEVEDDYTFTDRPIILFLRHTSFADTVLAVFLVSSKHNIRLRYVLKRDLLWDPCLDIVGHRLQNHFVRRGDVTGVEAAEVGRLAQDLDPREGVLIYPEGTRFTQKKRDRILATIRNRENDEAYGMAASYQNVLPPRMGGTLALLQSNVNADAVFCVHTGLQGSATLRDVLEGKLFGNTVHVTFWGVPFEAIPKTQPKRIDWFHEQWRRVDQWAGRRMPIRD